MILRASSTKKNFHKTLLKMSNIKKNLKSSKIKTLMMVTSRCKIRRNSSKSRQGLSWIFHWMMMKALLKRRK